MKEYATNYSSEFLDFVYESPMQRELNKINYSKDIFDEENKVTTKELPKGNGVRKDIEYVSWGQDNKLPYKIIEAIEKDEVMSQNKLFNVLTCYGSGLVYRDIESKKRTTDTNALKFINKNAFSRFFLEQATDMKFFYFCVSVIILSNDGKDIVSIRHKEASHIRFSKAKNGKIEYVLSANWNEGDTPSKVEVIPLLDEYDPLGDLNVRLGLEPNLSGEIEKPTDERIFAILCKFPTPGNRYYPNPYYSAFIRGDWYDIKALIARQKKAKIKNYASIRYHVQINPKFYDQIFAAEKITDPVKQKERVILEKERINEFISGLENSGKIWFSTFYTDPNGHTVDLVKINKIDVGKEGGDWSDDIEEASNMACFSDGVHPNMVGATPGKSQMNNSGSDKRELFTMKQALEVAFHDIMKTPHSVILGFNKWDDKIEVDVPMITLTTLDKNSDAQEKTRTELPSVTE